MAKRVTSVQNACAAAYTQNAGARSYVGYSHYTLAVDQSDLGFADYNWISTNAGEVSNTNSFTVIGYEVQIGGISQTIKWSGGASTSHTVPIDATNDETDMLLPSQFSLTKFAAGTIVMLKYIIDTGLLNGKLPATTYDKRAYTAITEQFQGYDPSTCTPSSISATGVFTATTGAFATVLNGNYRPILIGTPLVDGPSMLGQGDSQFAGQGDVNGAGTFQYGIGVFQKSTPYGAGKLMPSINLGRPGNTIAAVGGTNTKWRALMQYCTYFIFELGLNDANTGRTLVQIQTDTMTMINLAKAAGMKTIVTTKTPITTGAWALADGSDQTASPTPTPILDSLNSWYYTQASSGLIDYVIAYGEPVRNTTDSDKWKAPSITSDGTHALVGGVNLQTANGVVPFYNSLPSGATILTGLTNGPGLGIGIGI